MTKTQLQQLCNYVHWAAENGMYYGNYYQFYKRHDRLIEFVNEIQELISDPKVKIAK